MVQAGAVPSHAAVRPGEPAQRWDQLLHAEGLRATPARQLVLSALAELGHGTPEDLHGVVEARLAGLSLSTVYRTIETLAEHGVVTHTHLAGASTTYQLAAHGAHAHLVCRSCHEVTEIDEGLSAVFLTSIVGAHGFVADPAHLSVFGRCASCAAAAASA